MTPFPVARDRRLRRTAAIRRLVAETRLHPAALVLPLFVVPGSDVEHPIGSMPGHHQLSVDRLVPTVKEAAALGIGGVMLFGIPASKDPQGSAGWDPDGPVPTAIRSIAGLGPTVWADVCLCEYTSHGHCGVLNDDGVVDNDATLPLLARAAVTYAEAGADVIAPSDMMDGRVAAIRSALDDSGHRELAICSYAAKYASAYYGPFREAAESTPAFGDRRSHQMDPAASARQAVAEARRDVAEGADMVMVKPAGPYQDIITRVRAEVDVPVVAYQVSGEFSLIEAAAANGWVDREAVIMESLTGIARAGADVILTYFALEVARQLREAR